jgi:hypothetical protein
MNLRNPVNNLTFALLHAIETGLAGVPSALATDLLGPTDTGLRRRRPVASECHVVMFAQTMGTDELNFRDIVTARPIEVDTVIVLGPEGDACVYFSSSFGYHVLHPNRRFFFDVASQSMVGISSSDIYDGHDSDAAARLDYCVEMELSRLQGTAAREPGGYSELAASMLRYYADRIETAAQACHANSTVAMATK